jgi:HK97 gp10 family phage protein
MSFVTRPKNTQRLVDKLTKLPADVRREVMKSLVTVANNIRTTAVKKINKQGQGILYGKGRKAHRASAPGDPPSKDTGNLQSSINVTKDEKTLSAKVTVGANYGMELEFGTRKMAARPFMRPSIEENKADLPAGFRLAFTVSKPK